MIVASVLLILGAIVMLALGLAGDSNGLLYGSIAASLLAAITLYIGARQAAASRADDERAERDQFEPAADAERSVEDIREPALVAPAVPVKERLTERIPTERPVRVLAEDRLSTGERLPQAPPATIPIPVQPVIDDVDDPADDFDDEDPPDEPAPQVVSVADAVRIATMTDEVLVIDGRPRYHRSACIHLVGRDSEPLPVNEAVELGFTPCGRCEPDSALLAAARRV